MKPSLPPKPSAEEVAALVSKKGPFTQEEVARINEFFSVPSAVEQMTPEERERAVEAWLREGEKP